MADSQHNVNPPEPFGYASFGVDAEAFASQRTDPGPNLSSIVGPLLFAAIVAAILVLRGVGVLPS